MKRIGINSIQKGRCFNTGLSAKAIYPSLPGVEGAPLAAADSRYSGRMS
jgi:hypothetical protein